MASNTWQSINWKDPFLLEQQLSDDQRMVRDTAHQFAQEKLLPRVREAFRKEETDPSIFKEMGSVGLLGSTIQGIRLSRSGLYELWTYCQGSRES
jgi:glutaryl-CoA dehydrogenase